MATWTWEDGGVLSAELVTGNVKISVIQYRDAPNGTTWWAWLGESNVAFASGKGDSLEDGKQNALRETRAMLRGALGDVGAPLGESNVAFASGKGDSLEDGKQNALREVRAVLMGALGDVGAPLAEVHAPGDLYETMLAELEMPERIWFSKSRNEVDFKTRWANGNFCGMDAHGQEFVLDGLTQEILEHYLRARRVVEIVAKRMPFTRTTRETGNMLALVVTTELVDALAAVDKEYVFQYPTLKVE